MKTDLLQAAQDALFAALKPIEQLSGLPDGLGVYQHVPQDTEPPMIVLGQIGSASDEDKGEQVEDISAEIQCVYRGAGRAPLLAMMHAVRAALDGEPIGASDAVFTTPRFLKAEAGDAIADGVTYVGLVNFQFYAQPA